MNMDRDYIELNNVAERYVFGQLTPEEQDAFEDRLLWCRASQADVRRIEQLRSGLRDHVATLATSSSPDRQGRWTPMIAAAAAAVLAVGVTVTALRPSGSTGYATTNVFELTQVRGIDSIPVVDPARGDAWVTLMTYPEPGDFEQFRVLVERREADESWTSVHSSSVPIGSSDWLAVTLPRNDLHTGEHRIRVDGLRGNHAVPVFATRFRVEEPPVR